MSFDIHVYERKDAHQVLERDDWKFLCDEQREDFELDIANVGPRHRCAVAVHKGTIIGLHWDTVDSTSTFETDLRGFIDMAIVAYECGYGDGKGV